MNQSKTSVKSSLLLFLAALIWGVAFVAQSVGMEYMGPATFNGTRFLIGAVVLLPVIWFRDRKEKAANTASDAADVYRQDAVLEKENRKQLLIGGCSCGAVLWAASLLQQMGIQYTTVGKAGFLTAMYIILVPILGIFLHKKIGAKVWVGAGIAITGMYLLCMTGGLSVSMGDGLLLISALLFSVHIMVIDHFSPKADGVKLSCIQFFVSGSICMVIAFLTEAPKFAAIVSGAVPVLYAGILSCGVAYTLQVVGQKHVEPTVASLILSLESVVSVLAGWVILGQKLSSRELLGCALVFTAVILVQLPERRNEKNVNSYAFDCKETGSVVN